GADDDGMHDWEHTIVQCPKSNVQTPMSRSKPFGVSAFDSSWQDKPRVVCCASCAARTLDFGLWTLDFGLLNYFEIDPLIRHPVLIFSEQISNDNLQDILAGFHLRTELDSAAYRQPLQVG